MFDSFIKLNSGVSDFLWGYPMIISLFFGGVYLAYKSRFWVYKNFFIFFRKLSAIFLITRILVNLQYLLFKLFQLLLLVQSVLVL